MRLAKLLFLSFWVLGALACVSAPPGPAAPEPGFTLLAINDVYRIEGVDEGREGGLARLRSLRAELERETPDLLVLHAGDLLFPSLLSRLYEGEQMIDVLNRLDGDPRAFDPRTFVTFGNHEFDQDDLEDAAMLDRRIEESQLTWLGTDLEFARGADGRPLVAASNLVASRLVEAGGVRVGLFSLTTDEEKPAYVARFAEPLATARRASAELRARGAEVVIALTHQTIEKDKEILRQLGAAGPDLVIGGHEHQRQSASVDGRWVIKADAEARTATVARVVPVAGGPPEVSFEYRELGPEVPEDPALAAVVAAWIERHGEEYCRRLGEPAGCLDEVLGRTAVRLHGEELEIRRYETNLGNWIVDRALEALAPQGAQLAFLNAGSLRLNQDLPAGEITRRHVEEIFQYPSRLRLLRIPGSVLQEVVDHAVSDWTGQGKWLQVAGFAFRHDPTTATADRLTLLTSEGPRPIDPDEELLVVTDDYLANPATGQDGYTMLTEDHWVDAGPPLDLRDLVVEALRRSSEEGIAPRVEGRICNSARPGPCLVFYEP